jgi:uncharacterized LabA/DUF88 family protein
MLKGGIYLDMANLTLNGGRGMHSDVIKRLVEAQGVTIVQANAYISIDVNREREDSKHKQGVDDFRDMLRLSGFRIIEKPLSRYTDENGETVVKANVDLDLAVDALLQSGNLDYVLLGTGDRDFIPLVHALHQKGRRVDVLAFARAE